MLGVRGQADFDHYESRLKLVLGPEGYRDALDLLTEAAVHDGVLRAETIARYAGFFRARAADAVVPTDAGSRVPGHREHRDREAAAATVPIDVLRVLEHDGYLAPRGDGYHFVSGLLEDWWRARHGRYFLPIERRPVRHGA